MGNLIKYFIENKQWIFSGIGIYVLSGIGLFVRWLYRNYKNKRDRRVKAIDFHKEKEYSGNQKNIKNPSTPLNQFTIESYEIDGDSFNIVTGEISIGVDTWKAKVYLPHFIEIPEIELNRFDGRIRRIPEIVQITNDSFTITITNSDDSGKWVWKAKGRLMKKKE